MISMSWSIWMPSKAVDPTPRPPIPSVCSFAAPNSSTWQSSTFGFLAKLLCLRLFWRLLVGFPVRFCVCISRLIIADFLDHVLREYPSTKFLALKRSFFDADGENKDLGNGVLAFKGVYQAIRPAIVFFPDLFSYAAVLMKAVGTRTDCERRRFQLLLLGSHLFYGCCYGGT